MANLSHRIVGNREDHMCEILKNDKDPNNYVSLTIIVFALTVHTHTHTCTHLYELKVVAPYIETRSTHSDLGYRGLCLEFIQADNILVCAHL